jgi:mannose-1-phosphate guanylyltransferase
VPIDTDGRVEAFIEKPDHGTAPSNWINAGTYVLEPSVLASIPTDRRVSIERETFPALVERGELFGVQSDTYWIDAGTPAAYLQANLDLLDGVRGTFEPGIDATARIDADAKVSRSMIGPGAVVAAGTEVVDSVVMAGARIATGSRVERSVIGARSSVGESSELSDLTVVGYDQDLVPGTVASGGCFPDPDSW